MSNTIVNLWTATISNEIEKILTTYADHPYQQAFASPDLRQELIAFVLNHLPGRYITRTDSTQKLASSSLRLTSEEEQTLRQWIHQGIRHIFDLHSEAIVKHIPEADDAGLAPSHWFG